MGKLFLGALVLIAGQSAFASIIASQVSCQDLRAAVASGERQVVGKDGRVYNLESECGSNFIFKTTTGLCSVWTPGTQPDSCHNNDDHNGNG